jgi:helicase MOV-10
MSTFVQVLKHMSAARVLVCAPSNSAADLVTLKLLDHVERRQILRLNAYSRNPNTIPPEIKVRPYAAASMLTVWLSN